MEALLAAADDLVLSSHEPERPDFELPEEYSRVPTHEYIELKETSDRGRGWFAVKQIAAGTLIMVAKPIELILDSEDDTPPENEEDDMEDEAEEKDPRVNEILLLQILETLTEEPRLWEEGLSQLFPRNEIELSRLPAWVCADDAVFMQVERLMQELEKVPELNECAKDISKRLPHIIRYNILSIETCPELLSYPGPDGHSALAGVGLYHLPSFFNHSSLPNCSRWAVGDVMGFVANQNIAAGSEVCISYIEHDVLCESPFRRNQMLTMDFNDTRPGEENIGGDEDEKEGPFFPVVDSDIQNELMSTDPIERLASIEELMLQATGEKLPEEEEDQRSADDMETGTSKWFQCDIHNLRILKALTLDSLGKTQEALALWEESVIFAEEKLPPNDESSVVVRVQAALCALHAGEIVRAKEHAKIALHTHNLLFGGGVDRFRRRYQRDLKLALRPGLTDGPGGAPVDFLWPALTVPGSPSR